VTLTTAGPDSGGHVTYLDRGYITDREAALLPASARRRLEFSRMHLLPLEFYGRYLERMPRHKGDLGQPFVVARPSLPAVA
jgi:hypothetical protein